APQLLRSSRPVLHAVLDVCVKRFRKAFRDQFLLRDFSCAGRRKNSPGIPKNQEQLSKPCRFRGNYSAYYSPPVDFSYFLQNRNSWLGSTRQALSGLTYEVDRSDFRPAWTVEREILRTNSSVDGVSWAQIEEPFWFSHGQRVQLLPESCGTAGEDLKLFSRDVADDDEIFFKLASAADEGDEVEGEGSSEQQVGRCPRANKDVDNVEDTTDGDWYQDSSSDDEVEDDDDAGEGAIHE
ncbi:unnamed protein product, partial [Amoebophrya sp. A120]